MDDPKRRIKKIALLLLPVLIIGIVAVLLRGPNVSNALKRMILPELELMLGRKVVAQKIYLNIFPLFIEAKELKVFDEKGERALFAPRVKAYTNLTGLFSRQLNIRRLVIKEPELTINRRQAEEISDNVKKYLATVREDALKVKILAVEIQKGSASLADEENRMTAVIRGFDGETIIGGTQRIMASASEVTVKKEGLPEMSGDISVAMLVKDKVLDIKKLTVASFGSRAIGSGEYKDDSGLFKLDLSLFVGTFKKIFNLKKSGEGSVEVIGLISYLQKKMNLDLKLKGSFNIQLLMELLKVEERVEGHVTLAGTVKGPVDDLVAGGTAELRAGNLFDVDVDSLKCAVSYEDGTMKFSNGTGRFYNGSATVNASIALPVVNYYTVNVNFQNVDSRPLFKLIGWDPGVQPGKVTGTLKQAGGTFNPEGAFEYKSLDTGKNVIGRVRNISGKYRMKDDLVTLSGLNLSTGLTEVAVNGTADLTKKMLDFGGVLRTRDVQDLSLPYYSDLKGSGEFTGSITGLFSDPVITGKVRVNKPDYKRYDAEVLSADIRYKKDKLNIREMSVSGNNKDTFTMSGDIHFRTAAELFDLGNPEYDLRATARNAELGKFVRMYYADFQGSGTLRTDIRIRGNTDHPDITGKAVIDKAGIYGFPFDQAASAWSFKDTQFGLSRFMLKKGKSVVHGDASIDTEGRFSVNAGSEKVFLSDLVSSGIKGDAVFSARVEGGGTRDKHSIVLKADMTEGRLKDRPLGKGTITGELKDRDFSVRASLIDKRVNVLARGRLEKEVPWEAKVDIQSGRYDSLISAFLKDVPEDLILSMNGTVSMRGDRSNVQASSVVKQLNLSMYGYSFTNDADIRFDLQNRRLIFDRIVMRSGNTSVKVNGSLDIGKKYDLAIEGSSSLSPLKSLSAKIGTLRGDAEFVLKITGDWEKPMINGGLNLTNGSFSLKEYTYRVSSLNGYLYFDNDRVTLEKLTGKLGGGEIDISGILYLQKFSVKRFYVEAAMNNITAALAHDINVNFDGNILYKGTMTDQIISGDIQINRARYRERIEWKSWLLSTKKQEKFKSDISGLDKAALNLRVVGKENIHIDNNLARADVSADLLLRGSVYRPVLLGRLESKEGTVYFRNNEFRILHASADFSDPNRINPVIQVAAETIVKGYRIKMNLDGQLNRFNVSLSSDDPGLKETDILSLLTVGQTGGQLKGLEGGVGAGEATSFVTGKLQDVVEERLKLITGLDRFQVDPHLSRITGTVEPRVTVSKRLMGEKMFVTFSSSVNSAEEQIIKLEYFLSKNVSLIGVRDERGIIGGDLQFRFEFK